LGAYLGSGLYPRDVARIAVIGAQLRPDSDDADWRRKLLGSRRWGK
jgi:hypothetical protein